MADRYWDREREEDRGRRHRGEGYWGGAYDYPGERERERAYGRHRDERSFLERLRDELRSWFNEDESQRSRLRDERETGRWGGSDEPVDRDWARQWGYLEGRGHRGTSRGWGYGGWGYGVGEGPWRGEEYRGPSAGWGWSEQERHWRPTSSWAGYGAAEPERRDDPRRSGGGMFSRSFAGRGPRGYQRSDERIREDICERMCDSAELDASGIDIVVVSGEVTLQGTVSDRYDKRLAEDLTERVSGVREVNNQLRVSGTSGQEGSEQQQQQHRPGDPPRYRVA